ncbi:polyprotein [Phytophthora megakarya]|uniref:Polyprotein n=1 Tax=Phytophthora megakarya TaxID=4795 RepID=A0A225UMB2_9STRA|nr:polyprotein [Phytophthora megakarya]
MDFVFGLPPDERGRTGVLVFVDRFSKMVHFVPVSATVTAEESAVHFIDTVFRHHGMPASIVSDRDPRFTPAFWSKPFEIVGTELKMFTAAHPETDGQTERVNRVVEDVLRSYATSFQNWSSFLPLAEFAIYNAEHASTGLTPFFINNARFWRQVSDSTAAVCHFEFSPRGRERNAVTRSQTRKILGTPPDAASPIAAWTKRTLINPSAASPTVQPAPSARPIDTERVEDFVLQRQAIDRYVRDALQAAVDRQKLNADKRGRKNMTKFKTGDRVLLSTEGIRDSAVTNLGASKLAPRFIGPFNIIKHIGNSYTLKIPPSIRLHSTFYVGRLKNPTRSSSQLATSPISVISPLWRSLATPKLSFFDDTTRRTNSRF